MKRAAQEKPVGAFKNNYRNSISGITARASSYSSEQKYEANKLIDQYMSIHVLGKETVPHKSCASALLS